MPASSEIMQNHFGPLAGSVELMAGGPLVTLIFDNLDWRLEGYKYSADEVIRSESVCCLGASSDIRCHDAPLSQKRAKLAVCLLSKSQAAENRQTATTYGYATYEESEAEFVLMIGRSSYEAYQALQGGIAGRRSLQVHFNSKFVPDVNDLQLSEDASYHCWQQRKAIAIAGFKLRLVEAEPQLSMPHDRTRSSSRWMRLVKGLRS